MTKEKKVAIFDIDGTIFRSSLIIELLETLIDQGTISEEARLEYDTVHQKWLDREGDYHTYVMKVVGAFMEHIKGVHYGNLMDAANLVVERQQNRVYRYTRDLTQTLKKQDYYLLAISQSPKAILEDFCKNMGFDKVYGRIYETGATGKLTGNIIDEHLISNKANIVKRAIEKESLTLKGSVGVGDTEDDISFLELVERPICFNPNKKLYKYARINEWEVVVERKDVIYKL